MMAAGRFVLNKVARAGKSRAGLFGPDEYEDVRTYFLAQPELQPTPLRCFRSLASSLGVRDILVKDESARFGMDSFKIAGVLYTLGYLSRQGRLDKGSVLACATEGNHGRAVVRAARAYGLTAKIYVSSGTSAARVASLWREGGQVIVIDGSYDDAVRSATRDAAERGWMVFSDTSWPGYEEIPRLIMAGYSRLLDEAEEQWGKQPPSVVIVQAGVGSLACAVLSWLCRRYGARRPFTIICEPTSAACLLESARAGSIVSLSGPFNTIMAGLRCGEVSSIAWPVIANEADAFVAVDDEQCVTAMRALAHPGEDAFVVRTGPAGACGLAALLAILTDGTLRPLREASSLGSESRVLVFNTEGMTDQQQYERLLGNERELLDGRTTVTDGPP